MIFPYRCHIHSQLLHTVFDFPIFLLIFRVEFVHNDQIRLLQSGNIVVKGLSHLLVKIVFFSENAEIQHKNADTTQYDIALKPGTLRLDSFCGPLSLPLGCGTVEVLQGLIGFNVLCLLAFRGEMAKSSSGPAEAVDSK